MKKPINCERHENNMTTYIVTGATGHLGNTVVRKLLLAGEYVRCLVLEGEQTDSLAGLDCEIVYGDVVDRASLDSLAFGLELEKIVFIHSAGLISISMRSDPKVWETNVQGTKNVIDFCKEYKVERLVYVSSVHAIPEPDNKKDLITEVSHFDPDKVTGTYAKTKAAATQAVLDAGREGLDVVVVHPSGITGPNDWKRGHMTQVVLDYINGSLTALVKGGYDFVDVRDVAEGVIAAARQGRSGECYILTNRYFGMQEIVGEISNLTDRKRINMILPFWFARLFAPVIEGFCRLTGRVPLYTTYSLYTLKAASNFSNDKAKKELAFSTRPMEKTLHDTVAFLKQRKRFQAPVLLHPWRDTAMDGSV